MEAGRIIGFVMLTTSAKIKRELRFGHVRTQRPAMRFHDARDDRQTEAGSGSACMIAATEALPQVP